MDISTYSPEQIIDIVDDSMTEIRTAYRSVLSKNDKLRAENKRLRAALNSVDAWLQNPPLDASDIFAARNEIAEALK